MRLLYWLVFQVPFPYVANHAALERYPTKTAFLDRVREEAMRLVTLRYILAEDVDVVVGGADERYDAAVGVPERAHTGTLADTR